MHSLWNRLKRTEKYKHVNECKRTKVSQSEKFTTPFATLERIVLFHATKTTAKAFPPAVAKCHQAAFEQRTREKVTPEDAHATVAVAAEFSGVSFAF
ncbi:hypothetical protein TcasGA2_TC002143 [Tribolium castaneum]|uniref:Uncharacterized protein n=1 Tax=Tribolium castaneum TaxID=7070 RepID=D6WGS5_TRICA|nr:hypothetical protein TcasGA2_TC002143 [Tribolium castaneum]